MFTTELKMSKGLTV